MGKSCTSLCFHISIVELIPQHWLLTDNQTKKRISG